MNKFGLGLSRGLTGESYYGTIRACRRGLYPLLIKFSSEDMMELFEKFCEAEVMGMTLAEIVFFSSLVIFTFIF